MNKLISIYYFRNEKWCYFCETRNFKRTADALAHFRRAHPGISLKAVKHREKPCTFDPPASALRFLSEYEI